MRAAVEMLSPHCRNARLSPSVGRAAFMLLLLLPLLDARQAVPSARQRRGLELSSVHQLISDQRLGAGVQPTFYNLSLVPRLEESTFTGRVGISLLAVSALDALELHAHQDLVIRTEDISLHNVDSGVKMSVRRASRLPKRTIYVIRLNGTLEPNGKYYLDIQFAGKISDTPEGLFKGMYQDKDVESQSYYLATNLRPNNARRVFPCFDEPGFKTPFNVTILRPLNYRIQFNSPLNQSYPISRDEVLDHFQVTVPMSTFSFGFVMSTMPEVLFNLPEAAVPSQQAQPFIRIIGRKALHNELASLRKRVARILREIHQYFDYEYPFDVLNIVALPGFTALKPIDNWNVLVFKESDLTNDGYYLLAQELLYQWFGTRLSPNWWTDAHINKAIVGLLAAQITIEINNGAEFDGKWPMTQLYSIYYEFSKRYPHSRITALKQETTCTKTELVLRMLNYTIGSATFRNGLRRLFVPAAVTGGRPQLFTGDDVWTALSAQAHADGTLAAHMEIGEIVNSWIQKDRLPVVTVQRDYGARTASVAQKVYLRERPHDVPEQDKMLWWIPVIVVRQDRLDFANATPTVWMERERNVQLSGLPGAEEFVIVNPEEIGPYPVNYDVHNWNLLSAYLQTAEGRQRIPIYTRAKLLHDAWNLAYAGDLSFATALNMTLFMRHEREHLVWNPVFTLIDHIGNHIDMSKVHKKFETYVRILLTPLYEELGPVAVENEANWKENLRSLARLFLCRAGYKPCIEEAQTAYRKWMDSDKPDDGNPVPNQYICPVFKWGTQDEWEFGLQRIVNFPAARKQSERTYLLKCLVGCPMQTAKIERFLNLTVLEENGNFTDNDIFLAFNMLSSSSNGYINLFHFLTDNWAAVRDRFENRTRLWDQLISSATGVFTTQEGYDMVTRLYEQRRGEFGSAEHIIAKSLRNIKEETKWSAENLPVIEKWLDDYLRTAEDAVDRQQFLG